jgi:hypothetical protein
MISMFKRLYCDTAMVKIQSDMYFQAVVCNSVPMAEIAAAVYEIVIWPASIVVAVAGLVFFAVPTRSSVNNERGLTLVWKLHRDEKYLQRCTGESKS